MGVFSPNMYSLKNISIDKIVIPIIIDIVVKLSFIHPVIYSPIQSFELRLFLLFTSLLSGDPSLYKVGIILEIVDRPLGRQVSD